MAETLTVKAVGSGRYFWRGADRQQCDSYASSARSSIRHRSAYWSPFVEISHTADADRIAHQLIVPTGKDEDDVWLETARILVANILRMLRSEGKTSLPDLLNAL